MSSIEFIDRITRKKEKERVYGEAALQLLYGTGWFNRLVGAPLRYLASHWTLFSRLFGWFQKQRWTKRNIQPFIAIYGIDRSEFLDPVDSFCSFNDFFIRKLKPQVRPIAPGDQIAVLPADGRYRFFSKLSSADLLDVKGQRLNLAELLGDLSLAQQYESSSLVMARLCPSDYHRFHFPIRCIPGKSRLINGTLYSVNPLAVKQNITIFSQNKRALTILDAGQFGEVLYIEVGATAVGTIQQTYTPDQQQEKGAEKGYFSFGGSALLLLFPEGSLELDDDLLQATRNGLEMRCLMGQRLGRLSSSR